MPQSPILKRNFDAASVKKEYANVAWVYDLWGALTESKAQARLVDLADLKNGDRILEVAVGTGRLLASLAERFPASEFNGVDLSPAMLARARKRFKRKAQRATYDLREGSAYALPYADAGFDALINTYMLDLLPLEDQPRVLGEFHRVLKPGGKLLLAYFSNGARRRNRLWPWLAKHFPALLTGCRPIEPQEAVKVTGFSILAQEEVSQNTFPSAIIVARKNPV